MKLEKLKSVSKLYIFYTDETTERLTRAKAPELIDFLKKEVDFYGRMSDAVAASMDDLREQIDRVPNVTTQEYRRACAGNLFYTYDTIYDYERKRELWSNYDGMFIVRSAALEKYQKYQRMLHQVDYYLKAGVLIC